MLHKLVPARSSVLGLPRKVETKMLTIDVSQVTLRQWFKIVFVATAAASLGGGIGQFLADRTLAWFL